MLTRLEVHGFKNLRRVDVPLGPFTCIAGANAVGKSNLFDAIQFLSDLATYPIVEAAARVRDPGGRTPDLRSLFTRSTSCITDQMTLAAEFVVPGRVVDDFGRQAEPSATFLRYEVKFRLVEGSSTREDRIELESESLDYIRKGKAKARLGFPHSKDFFSVIEQRRTRPLISSDTLEGEPVIRLHQDRGTGGRPAFMVHARNSPKTIVGATNTIAEPTVLAARREMQSWVALQLEPTALRKPDDFGAPARLSPSGEYLPSTLHRLGCPPGLATDLAELLPDVREVLIDSDEGRRLRTLKVAGRDGLEYAARSLSDGTLRFLALAAMRYDPEFTGLICFEEPENGLHPSRIPAMLRLLEDIAVDPTEIVDRDNPLRQVVINTHSPVVVQNLPLDTLVFAKSVRGVMGEETVFQCLPGTWRTQGESAMDNAPLGELLPYLMGTPVKHSAGSTRESVLAFAAKQAELEFVFKDQ